MTGDSNAGGTPQFSRAEYAGNPGVDQCRSCSQSISGAYYRVNGAMTCENCAQRAKQLLPKDTHQAYVRGIAFGVGGAILGLILYAAFGIITGLVIGYVSLAVGYIVGKAIKFGSNGMGGRRYQIAAAFLTYAAVSMAAVPIGIAQYAKEHPPARPPSEQVAPMGDMQASPGSANQQKPKMNLGKALAGLALLGLASPFLELQNPIQGGIGLIILFVGIRIAWQMTGGSLTEIIGPFNSSSPPPAHDQTATG